MAAIFYKLPSNKENSSIRGTKSKMMRKENVNVQMLQPQDRLGRQEDQIRLENKIKKVTKVSYTYFDTLVRPERKE